jgi:hypothetical protein
MDDLTLKERQVLWTATYKALQEWCRYWKIPFVAVWARESDRRTSMGEHWHVLMFLPQRHWRRLRKIAKGWARGRLKGPEAVDLRLRDYQVSFSQNGVSYTSIDYLRKASPATARKSRPFYRPSGLIHGSRAGATLNIRKKAIAAWEARMERLNADAVVLARGTGQPEAALCVVREEDPSSDVHLLL